MNYVLGLPMPRLACRSPFLFVVPAYTASSSADPEGRRRPQSRQRGYRRLSLPGSGRGHCRARLSRSTTAYSNAPLKRLVHLDGGDEPRQAASAVVCLQGFHFARHASRRLRLRLHKHPCRRKERARLRSEGSRYSDHGHFNALHGANTNAVQLCGFNDPRSLGERLANRRHYIRSQNARYEHFGP